MEIMSLKNQTGGENDTLTLFIPLSTQVLCVYEPSSLNTHTHTHTHIHQECDETQSLPAFLHDMLGVPCFQVQHFVRAGA